MRMRRWLALALSALILFVSGCQAVQGIDLNGVLKQSSNVMSTEGSVAYEFEVKWKEDEIDEVAGFLGRDVLLLLSRIKLVLDHVKVQDPLNVSARGALHLGGAEIGFSMRRTGTELALKFDGADAPIVMDLREGYSAVFELLSPGVDELILPYDLIGFYSYGPAFNYDPFGLEAPFGLLNLLGLKGGEMPEMSEMPEEHRHRLLELERGAKRLSDEYWTRNMPNLSGLSISPGTPASVGGEELNLVKVSARFDGAELLDWSKNYIEALTADETGLRAVLRAIYPLEAEWWQLLKESGLIEEFEVPEEPDIAEFADDVLEELRDTASAIADQEAEEPESFHAIYNDSLRVSADFYFDDRLRVRKQQFDIRYRPPAEPNWLFWSNPYSGAESVRIKYAAEWWNINGEVALEPSGAAKDAGISLEDMFDWSTADFIRFIGTDSGLFDLIFKRMKAGVQELRLYPDDETGAPIPAPNGTTLVPLRSTAAEFGVELRYDPQTRQLLLRDDITGTDILLTAGSRLVAVNGETVEWSHPVTVSRDGKAYVPGRDLMKALGGTIRWGSESGRKVLILKRDIAELIRP
jgi:Copper amine oxidase N-terminal domain.